MTEPDHELKDWIEKEFFHASPLFIAALDKELNIVYANKAYTEKFGAWQGRKCFDVYKKKDSICEDCTSRFAFSNRKTSVSEQTGFDKNGKLLHYIKYTLPVINKNDEINYLVEISTDTTSFIKTKREYKLLFDQVPCNIIIIDREFRIVRANKRALDMLGSISGEYCYATLKNRNEKCLECTARRTFEDGTRHTGNHEWTLKNGSKVNMHVITALIKGENKQDDLVMEMAVDISNTLKLQDRIESAHQHLESLINTSMDGIVGITSRGKVNVFNTAARNLFNISPDQIVSLEDLTTMLPQGFLAQVSEEKDHVYLPDATLKKSDGENFHGRLIGNTLEDIEQTIGMAFSVKDLTNEKKLEEEKIEAERLAIVGQTVAGLAHGIKNLINALEGGMYYLKSGIGKSDINRIHKGIETLDRNISRINLFSRSFLNYSKNNDLNPELCDPVSLAKEVVESFSVSAKKNQIKLKVVVDEKLEPAIIDYEKIHECLTNLVGNAIDACIEDTKTSASKVEIKISEKERVILFEIIDNGCGIDKENRKKLFNKFFTTKGLNGTGLGLLMAKKIAQEHGGNLDVISKKGKGTTFRIRLFRRWLPKIKE
ncbi:MAG: PAS domain S-box protein [Desulfobacteraceae bacterium]|nr:PAS domain S-box protein [Desulfobacteraceae bacterium]